jgi:N6-adenosine-specific RNA methylase IME4
MTDAMHYLIVAGIFWAVICRARLMDDDTRTRLKVQYGALLAGSVLSLPMYGLHQFGSVLLGASTLLYLWLDAPRWRDGAPNR